MAELLLAQGWPDPDSLGILLRDALPEAFYVVAEPKVAGLGFDAIVVGPQGLFTVQGVNWEGQITPARFGSWVGRMPSGQSASYPNPSSDVRQAEKAVQAFLHDEFAGVQVPIHHILVLASPGASMAASDASGIEVVNKAGLPDTIESMPAPFKGSPLSAAQCEELAVALRDRQLTATQRAAEPFVFRSGGLFSTGRRAWTIRDVVHHMDRHPEVGLYHLRNGTLAAWLSKQGAEHLAKLAKEVLQHYGSDPRAVVETFLIRTGLVQRPKLVVRPRSLYLGPVVAGENCEARLRVRRKGRRGYLFGRVHTSEPWLRVEPTSFRERLDAIVSADTENLPISHTPRQAQLLIESTSTEEPIPVKVRVVAMPSALNRRLLRPLAGAVGAGSIGATIGAALHTAGLELPSWAARRLPLPITPLLFWMGVVGLFWALLGALRGLRQPRHWPVSYAVGRWLLRWATWAVVLAVLVSFGHWTYRQLGPAEAGSQEPSVGLLALIGLSLSILPATMAEIRLGKASHLGQLRPRRRPGRRTFVLLAGLVLALGVVLGVPLLGRLWLGTDVNRALVSAQDWAEVHWDELETRAGNWMDRLFLRYYDRRAPASTPTALPTSGTPEAAVTPPPGSSPSPLTPVAPTLVPMPTQTGPAP